MGKVLLSKQMCRFSFLSLLSSLLFYNYIVIAKFNIEESVAFAYAPL